MKQDLDKIIQLRHHILNEKILTRELLKWDLEKKVFYSDYMALENYNGSYFI